PRARYTGKAAALTESGPCPARAGLTDGAALSSEQSLPPRANLRKRTSYANRRLPAGTRADTVFTPPPSRMRLSMPPSRFRHLTGLFRLGSGVGGVRVSLPSVT